MAGRGQTRSQCSRDGSGTYEPWLNGSHRLCGVNAGVGILRVASRDAIARQASSLGHTVLLKRVAGVLRARGMKAAEYAVRAIASRSNSPLPKAIYGPTERETDWMLMPRQRSLLCSWQIRTQGIAAVW
jgi:hypothetical protein